MSEQHVSSKDDPLTSDAPTFGRRTLWLEREGMHEARENFWQGYLRSSDGATEADRHTWDVAYAAAVAAFMFVMEGRLEPKR